MIERTTYAQLLETIEEELGSLRQFADLPATEIEDMAARIVRAIISQFKTGEVVTSESKAA